MSIKRPLFILIAALLVLPFGRTVTAQSSRGNSAVGLANQAAKSAAAAGHLDEAVASVETTLRRKPNSAEWHLEKALALVRLGLTERNEGRGDHAVRLGNEALRQLAQAERKADAADHEMKADIKAMAATVLERLSGNSSLAWKVRDQVVAERSRGGGAALDAIITIPDGKI